MQELTPLIAEYDDSDLLRANPNHTGAEWQDSDEDEDEDDEDEVEVITDKFGNIIVQ